MPDMWHAILKVGLLSNIDIFAEFLGDVFRTP
jgi:hypothetical protein